MKKTRTTGRYPYEAQDLASLTARIGKEIRIAERWEKPGSGGNPGDSRLLRRNIRAFQGIRNAIERGDYPTARRIARRLDTWVADQIPVRLYSAITR